MQPDGKREAGTEVRRLACTVALVGLLMLVVGHGVHDAFHADGGGVGVCIALSLGLVGVRFAAPRPVEPAGLVHVLAPTVVVHLVPHVVLRSRGSPSLARVPLRL